jgi:hypothetical protein
MSDVSMEDENFWDNDNDLKQRKRIVKKLESNDSEKQPQKKQKKNKEAVSNGKKPNPKEVLAKVTEYHNDPSNTRSVSRTEAEAMEEDDENIKLSDIQQAQKIDDNDDEDEDVIEEITDPGLPVPKADIMSEKDTYFMESFCAAKQLLQDLDTPYDHRDTPYITDTHLYCQLKALEDLWLIPEKYKDDERVINQASLWLWRSNRSGSKKESRIAT